MRIQNSFTLGTFADLCLSSLEDAAAAAAVVVPELRKPLRKGQSAAVRRGELLTTIDTISTYQPPVAQKLTHLENTLQRILSASKVETISALWDSMSNGLAALEVAGGASPANLEAGFELIIDPTSPKPLILRERGSTNLPGSGAATPDASQFINSVTNMCAAYRAVKSRRYFPADRLALLRAYQLVESGVRPGPAMQPIRTDALRGYPTYLSFADPGPGHLCSTVLHQDLLAGTIVHIETIDRGGVDDRGKVEAYRIPSIRDVARIRVHVGAATPCSVYVGRPVFEGYKLARSNAPGAEAAFEQSLLKAAHTVGAACSGLFALGVAECKIGLDGLTARQALGYMRALAGNVIRDRFCQRLSAAFNINTPIWDDRQQGRDMEVQVPLEVARLGLRLAKAGGFEKVTWDGASNKPSKPILGQLSNLEVFNLVHEAHELGLETYISAGMEAQHMLYAAEIGIGGVGIGTRLHSKAPNGALTEIIEDAVREVLNARNLGMKSDAGKAAAALAKLDWQHSVSPLEQPLENVRQKLADVLRAYHDAFSAPTTTLETVRQQLKRTLEETSQALSTLKAEAKDADHVTRGGSNLDDPVFSIARSILERAVKESSSGLSSDALMIRRLLEEGDSEGLRYWLGAS